MKVEVKPDDTWVGVPFSEEQIVLMASECGFESRYRIGLGEQEFWNWFFKPFSDEALTKPKVSNALNLTE
jgi:hypothetical protein